MQTERKRQTSLVVIRQMTRKTQRKILKKTFFPHKYFWLFSECSKHERKKRSVSKESTTCKLSEKSNSIFWGKVFFQNIFCHFLHLQSRLLKNEKHKTYQNCAKSKKNTITISTFFPEKFLLWNLLKNSFCYFLHLL